MCHGAIVFEAEDTRCTQVNRGAVAVAIAVGYGLGQQQCTFSQGQYFAVIGIGGVVVPEVVQQLQGHFTTDRVDGQGEIRHATGAAGNHVAQLVQDDLFAFAQWGTGVHRKQAAGYIRTAQLQVVYRAVITCRGAISTEHTVKLRLHHRCAQHR